MSKKIAVKIYYDEYSGEVTEIKGSKRFSDEGPLLRIDILKDCISALEEIYEIEKNHFFNKFNEVGET